MQHEESDSDSSSTDEGKEGTSNDVKGKEDIRLDERVMQLFGLINGMLETDAVTSRRDLAITRYNVLPRDDKSFPYILLTGDHAVPRIAKHRGAQTREGSYYGPFASAGAVNRTITALEKAFLLRSCSDAVFASRTRPCLMYQIKRCSAPCVGRISEADYLGLVEQARDFLTGKSQAVQGELAEAMEEAAERLDYEAAARYRDRIRALAHIQSHQDINVEGVEDADVLAAHQEGGITCVQVFFFRAGRNYGNRAYFPSHDKTLGPAEVLAAFVAQFYDNKPVPREVQPHAPPDLLEEPPPQPPPDGARRDDVGLLPRALRAAPPLELAPPP